MDKQWNTYDRFNIFFLKLKKNIKIKFIKKY